MAQRESRSRRPTQYDVARLAGVSQTTVSHILNNNALISVPEETRQRTLAAIQELGYIPDRNARSLRTQKTYTIAAIIPDITNPYYPSFMRGIQDVAESHDFDLITYNSDGFFEKEVKCLRSIQHNRVDGLITALFHDHDDFLLRLDIPVVKLDRKPKGPHPFDIVYFDNVAAARIIVNHLVAKGYLPIAMIAGVANTPADLRSVGYRQALQEHNLPVDENLVIRGNYAEKGGYEAMQKLLAQPRRPRAVFAANDLMAMGAMLAIHEARLRIPQDIAIAGVDDIPAARLVNPPLTTINQFQENIGRQAAEMLFERINGTVLEDGRTVEYPFEFVIRESA
jgi:LacI family transcriptional regulator